jgi:putative transposase
VAADEDRMPVLGGEDINMVIAWDKARVRVARAPAHVKDARRDFHHKLSTAIIRENQAVYVEDLAVRGLARTRLAKSVGDAGWSAFVSMLEYKAKLHGRDFHPIGRWEPTSQVCSATSSPWDAGRGK